jgi:hypothetical protein
MMDPVVLDLICAERGHEGNPRKGAIDDVVLEVGEPVSELEREVVEKARGKESHRCPDGKTGDHESVVASEENGEDPETTRDMRQVRGVPGPKVGTVKDAVMLDVVETHVPQQGQSPMHREAVHPVLEEIRVEDAGEKPERQAGARWERQIIEMGRCDGEE